MNSIVVHLKMKWWRKMMRWKSCMKQSRFWSRREKAKVFPSSLVKNLLSSFKTTSAMAYNFHFNVSRQLLDQVPAASFFFFLNLQKKLLDQNFSYAALLDEKEAKGNSLVPKLDTLLSLFSFPSSNIDEKSATFSLEGKN